MAESANPVRQLQHHLRQAGALIAARELDAASAHIDAALALDPASLAALTLRERLRARAHGPAQDRAAASTADGTRITPAEPESMPEPPRFIPSGVNAASWIDFEHRIQERRFRALIESAQRAVAAGDGIAARLAVEEARELRPHATEVEELSGRAALMPAALPGANEGFLRSRTMRAASILLVGITLLMGLDWLRSETPAAASSSRATIDRVGSPSAPLARPSLPDSVPFAADRSLDAAPPARVETTAFDEDVTPPIAVAAPEEPVAIPAAVAPPPSAPRAAPATTPAVIVPGGEIPDTYVAPPARRAAGDMAPAAVLPTGEIPDDYVAPQATREIVRDPPVRETSTPATRSGSATPSNGVANVVRQPASIAEPLGAARGAASPPSGAARAPSAAGGAVVPTRAVEVSGVESALQQYARGYGRLDASAVKIVYPGVNEQALARAFSDLESQDFSFENCDIDIAGQTATASCRGNARYVVKVGSHETRTEPRTWKFDLMREGESWKIAAAETRR